jgi:fumarate reductase subunit D
MGGKGTAREAVDWIDLVDYGDQFQALVTMPVGLIFYNILYIFCALHNYTHKFNKMRLGIMNRMWFM